MVTILHFVREDEEYIVLSDGSSPPEDFKIAGYELVGETEVRIPASTLPMNAVLRYEG